MIRALILKELREHGWVFGAFLLLGALAFAAQSSEAVKSGGVFVALRNYAYSFGLLGALLVCNRLVVREFAGRTQLFLETLPVTRTRVLAVKCVLGWILCALPVAAALGVCWLRARGREPVSGLFLALLAARAGGAIFAFFGFAFLAGVLGRYRIGLWLVAVLTLITLETRGKLQIEDLPIARLLGPRMPFERFEVPTADLLGAVGFGFLCLGMAAVLALAREGAISSFLSQRMTYREKVFFAGAALLWALLQAALDDREQRPPFALKQAERASRDGAVIGVALGKDLSPEVAQEVATRTAALVVGFRDWLGMSELPPLFLVPSQALDADTFLTASLPKSDGVVVEAALGDPGLDRQALDTFVLEDLLGWYSRGRSGRESQRWLSDAIVASRVDAADPARVELDRLRAVAALPTPLTREALREWLTTRERLGDCLADAVAARLGAALASALGPAGYQALAHRALGNRPWHGGGVVFGPTSAEEWLRGSSAEVPALLAAFNASLAEDRAALAPRLSAAGAAPRVWPVPVNHATSEVHYGFADGGSAPADFAVRLGTLGPWSGELERSRLNRYDASEPGVLPQTVTRGERLFTAVEWYEPTLKCVVRAGASRWEAP